MRSPTPAVGQRTSPATSDRDLFHNRVALPFDLLTSLTASGCHGLHLYQRLVLITQALFLLEHGHTDRHTHKVTDTTDPPIHGSVTAGLRKYIKSNQIKFICSNKHITTN